MTDALSVESIGGAYGGVPILRGISLRVAEGEVVAVIGRNGVGKTTLMKTIMGLTPVTFGSIRYRGADVTRLDSSARARLGIGYVPQGREIFQTLTVEENLVVGELVGKRAGNGRHSYDYVFELFPTLHTRRKQRAGTLSGGEQQMLAIGRVLVGRPQLLLLDEPSEGIQPSVVQDIGRVVRRLRDEEGYSVLLVEQNVDLVRLAADRCEVVEKGAIVAHLQPEDLADVEVAKRYLAV